MRGFLKVTCFLMLTGMFLNCIYTLSSIIYEHGWVSPCSSEQECVDQYIRNISHCLPFRGTDGQENVCGDAIDPAYISNKDNRDNWETRTQKISDTANSEKKKLSPEALQAKQERIREALKNKYHISEGKYVATLSVFLALIILPIVCYLTDWILARKARRILLQGEAPSTLIMLFLCLLFAGALGTMGLVLIAPDFNPVSLSKGAIMGAILLLLAGVTYLLAKAIKQEFLRFRGFVCAVKKVKASERICK